MTEQDLIARREAAARIIDPYAWERRDEFAALLRGEGLSSDQSLAAMQTRSAGRRIDKVVADSLAKADAILTTLEASRTPEGMVLVPREPTEAMIDAGLLGLSNAGLSDLNNDDAKQCWTSMLSASPQPKEG